MVLSRLLGPQECQICQQAHFLTWRSMSLMLQEAIQPTAHLQLSCPRPLISLYVSIWAFPLDLWYPRPPFRGWTGGSRAAGSAQGDAIRNITGKLGETIHTELFDGVFYIGSTTGTRSYPEGGYTAGFPFLDASRVVPTAAENRPANIALPVALYLGLPA